MRRKYLGGCWKGQESLQIKKKKNEKEMFNKLKAENVKRKHF